MPIIMQTPSNSIKWPRLVTGVCMNKRKSRAGKVTEKKIIQIKSNQIVHADILPSSVWVSHGHVASTATPPANPTRVRRRRTSPGAHLIVIPAGGRHGSPSSSAGGHSVKPAVSTAGSAPAHGEPTHKPATTSPLFKHDGETTVFVRFIIEVGVVGLCTAFYGSLKKRRIARDILSCSRAFEMHSLQEYNSINGFNTLQLYYII